MSDDPKWIAAHHVQRLHDKALEITKGAEGVRDQSLLSSAVARPQNLHAYGEKDLFVLAASYAEGIARNHPFVDGNKRAAFLAADLFLSVNGRSLDAVPAERHAEKMVALAKGEITREGFASYLRDMSKEMDRNERAQEGEHRREEVQERVKQFVKDMKTPDRGRGDRER